MSRSVYAIVEVGLVLILAACAGLVMTARPAAPGETASPPEPTAAPAAGGSPALFFVRPYGGKGIAVAYDATDGTRRFTLPSGMMSADGRRYFAAMPVEAGTRVSRFDLSTGEEVPGAVLQGVWDLSGLSATGRWLALTRRADEVEKRAWKEAGQWHTEVQIFDAETNETRHHLVLDGNFEAETIAIEGGALFLIEHLPAIDPDHYVIRLYDLSKQALAAEPLRLKGSDEVMAGQAWEGTPSKDGRWLFTLYLNTAHQESFVHGLNLAQHYTVCIDLPSGKGGVEPLKSYTLSLSPDGRTLYAANAVLGLVAEVNLDSLQTGPVESFAPQAAPVDGQYPTGRSVLSADGRTLYFTGGEDVWVYDTAKHDLAPVPLRTSGQIAGLGLSPDGARLFAAGEAYLLGVFDLALGAASR